ncbi:MAG: SDR family NAD(P)-dependent oxidoreductase, partial [Alphaproteobacteria bacterium]|nr:SDR family NAD(P)-dependent oxidoreductase [Alphaproteobacteria bacterium]
MDKGWILVTGAAKRLGREISLELARHGWDIIAHYNTSEEAAKSLAKEIQDLGRDCCLLEMDLNNLESVKKLVPYLWQELGAIKGIVNNAAVFEPDVKDPLEQEKLIAKHMAVNAEAARILSKTFYDETVSAK